MKAAVKFSPFGKRKPGIVGGPTWWRETASEPVEEAAGPRPSEILVPESAVEDLLENPAGVLAAALDHTRFLLTEALYLPEEISADAHRSTEIDLYLREVETGGHKRYIASCGFEERSVRACNEGLAAVAPDTFGELFHSLIRYMEEDPLRAELLRQGTGFGNIDGGLVELDKRFFACGGTESVLPRHVEWLLASPDVRVVPDDDMAWERQRLLATNPQRESRLAAIA